ncbi:MAG TPA: septum formation initiator family protein [Clostridiales bacterium]|nr:septum formation initiator family protein [Clostridiales bacterium]
MARYRMKPRLKIFLFLLVALVVVSTLVTQQLELNRLNKDKSQIISKIEDLKKENEYIKQQINAADTDEFVENAAREKLGMVKEGEIKYMPVE